jgi:uncharacterized OsmC-like protein
MAKDGKNKKVKLKDQTKPAKKKKQAASSNGVAPAPELPPFRDRQRALKTSYRENPALAKIVSAVRSVTPDDADAGKVRIAIENEAGVTLDVGAHVSVGGIEDAGCSGDYFLASLAACYEITLRLVAAASRITINRLDLRVEGDWDARGTLGIDPDVAVGFTGLRVLVDLDATGPEERLAQLQELTERYCVVSQTLRKPPEVTVSFTAASA